MGKTQEQPEKTLEAVAAPPLGLGRIVHFNLGTEDEPKLRAAVSLGDQGGVFWLQVLVAPGDIPFAHGTNARLDAYGNVVVSDAAEGEAMGQWRWPVIPGRDESTPEPESTPET